LFFRIKRQATSHLRKKESCAYDLFQGIDELVASLARPGGNATGINFFFQEIVAKRLGLLHDLVPKAVRVAVLINPANAPVAETTLRGIPEAARALGLQIQVLEATTSREIEAAFATLVRDRADALFVAPDAFFVSRRVQFVTLATRHGIPSAHTTREEVEAGGLMSYGPDSLDMYHRVGFYTGQILKGAKPADLPVLQSTKFEFAVKCGLTSRGYPLAGLLSCAWRLTVWSPVHGPREPTSGYVKLLLPPRQSRGNSLVCLEPCRAFRPAASPST
jgi:hypothetical protein